jgi:uncharacterized Fe-S cluster protein YjdI
MSAKTMIEALTDHKKLWKMKGETKLFNENREFWKLWKMKGETKLFDENREFWFEWEESDRIV